MNVKAVNLKNQLGPTLNGEKAVELDVATTVVTTKIGSLSSHALVNVKTNDVFVTFDGETPASGTNTGILLKSGYLDVWSKRMINNAKFIQSSAAAKVRVEPLTD